jgi:hypothetical protein
MSSFNQTNLKKNPWYPRHVSDRVNELLDELNELQCQRLYDEFKKITIGDWFFWLEENRDEISRHDGLSLIQRRKNLNTRSSVTTLKLHHACIFIELWRVRTTNNYFLFPPSGLPLENVTRQREMMLDVCVQ